MTAFAVWVGEAMDRFAAAEEELTALDAAAGDGDLGYTISAGARAIKAAVADLPENASWAEALRTIGMAFARGNPSSFAALCAGGLLAASRALDQVVSPTQADVVRGFEAASDSISTRGGAKPGDRTVLDALLPSIEALRAMEDDARDQWLDALIVAAREGAGRTADMAPRRGRAAWVGTVDGHKPDGGAVAYVRLLEALEATRKALP